MTPGFFVARALTAPAKRRVYPLRVLASTSDTVTVPATAQTITAGQWGLFSDDHAHVTISGAPVVDGMAVTWRVSRGKPPRAGSRVAWTGIVHPTADAAGFDAHDHLIETPVGAAPAWYIGAMPRDERPVWAVHLYGLGSTRAGVLRAVRLTTDAGLPSVLPTYRNSIEGVRWGNGRTRLGADETADIAAVLEELSVTGDERFVLVGWSMGAQIALSLAADARWSSRIDRIVLESPVLDWRQTLCHAVRRESLPRAAGAEAAKWLRNARVSRFVGMDPALDLDAMDWVRRAGEVTQPVLILHGAGDASTPFSVSRSFADVGRDVHLVDTGGGHTTGWNVNPERWSEELARFLAREPLPHGG